MYPIELSSSSKVEIIEASSTSSSYITTTLIITITIINLIIIYHMIMQVVGRVERVGWGQTRIRGRDTRPTYVPNAHFVQTAVTNMERITHRKFEATVPIRFSDYALMNDVINRIKDRLKNIAKLDVLSMPFRVSFVRVGSYCLEIEITCYFATKSIDEYLALQQVRWILMMDGLADALMVGWMVAWMVEWLDGWMEGVFILFWFDRYSSTIVIC